MLDLVKQLQKEVASFVPSNKDDLDTFRLKYLTKKGVIGKLFSDFKLVDIKDKKKFGQEINNLKKSAEAIFKEYQNKPLYLAS